MKKERNDYLLKGNLFNYLKIINYDTNDKIIKFDRFRDLLKVTQSSISSFYLFINDKFYIEYFDETLIEISDKKIIQAIKDFMVGKNYIVKEEFNLVKQIINMHYGNFKDFNIDFLDEELFNISKDSKENYKDIFNINRENDSSLYVITLNENFAKEYNNFLQGNYPIWYKRYMLETIV